MIIITSSLSQGNKTTASGLYSHAEGNTTTSRGIGSHAEGEQTIALGNYSHAEGSNTLAKGAHSHTSGLGTIAFSNYQTVIGQYNKDKNSEDYFIVGVGDILNRKDGFGISPTRTYVSTSLLLPNLTKDSNIEILTYNTSTKQVHYGLLSELYIGNTDYATQALTASYSELAKEAKYSSTSNYSTQAQQAQQSITSVSSSYSEQAINAFQAVNASFAINAQQANISFSSSYSELAKNALTASYIDLAQQSKTAITASYVTDPTVVKTFNDVIKLKPVDELPWFMDPGALALYNGDLYFCIGMAGWKKIILSNTIIPVSPPK